MLQDSDNEEDDSFDQPEPKKAKKNPKPTNTFDVDSLKVRVLTSF